MGVLDDILRPIATSVITEFGTTVAVTKILRTFDKATLQDVLADSDTATLPCTRRDFSTYEVAQSGGKIVAGDVQLTVPAESWEGALPADPLPRVLNGEEIRCAVAEGDATPTAYRLERITYGVAQSSMAVYRLHLRRTHNGAIDAVPGDDL